MNSLVKNILGSSSTSEIKKLLQDTKVVVISTAPAEVAERDYDGVCYVSERASVVAQMISHIRQLLSPANQMKEWAEGNTRYYLDKFVFCSTERANGKVACIIGKTREMDSAYKEVGAITQAYFTKLVGGNLQGMAVLQKERPYLITHVTYSEIACTKVLATLTMQEILQTYQFGALHFTGEPKLLSLTTFDLQGLCALPSFRFKEGVQ